MNDLVQRLHEAACDTKDGDIADLLREAVDALRAAREDAERYRWLRDSPNRPCKVPCAYAVMPGDVEHPTPLGGETLDKAIDAAREARNG